MYLQYQGLPSPLGYSKLATPNFSLQDVLRTFHHSSDESDAFSASGGGGSHGQRSPSRSNTNSDHGEIDDTPYIPRRTSVAYSPTHTVILPPGEGVFQTPLLPPTSRPTGSDQDQHTESNRGRGQRDNQPHTHRSNVQATHTGPWRRASNIGNPRPAPSIILPTDDEPPSTLTNPTRSQEEDETGKYLRRQLQIPHGVAINLHALPDASPGQKPEHALPILMKLAIYGSPKKKLTLQEIYTVLESRFEWFRRNSHKKAWKNSIRHNLSLNKVFRSSHRPITEPGKGSYWELDISEGEGYKRERKRRKKSLKVNTSQDDEEQPEDQSDSEEISSSNADSPVPLRGPHGDFISEAMALVPIHGQGVQRTMTIPRRSSPYPVTSVHMAGPSATRSVSPLRLTGIGNLATNVLSNPIQGQELFGTSSTQLHTGQRRHPAFGQTSFPGVTQGMSTSLSTFRGPSIMDQQQQQQQTYFLGSPSRTQVISSARSTSQAIPDYDTSSGYMIDFGQPEYAQNLASVSAPNIINPHTHMYQQQDEQIQMQLNLAQETGREDFGVFDPALFDMYPDETRQEGQGSSKGKEKQF